MYSRSSVFSYNYNENCRWQCGKVLPPSSPILMVLAIHCPPSSPILILLIIHCPPSSPILILLIIHCPPSSPILMLYFHYSLSTLFLCDKIKAIYTLPAIHTYCCNCETMQSQSIIIEYHLLHYLLDLGIVSDNCSHGSVRLMDGTEPFIGRVELCINGIWGTVCNRGWRTIDARVACRQVNYPGGGQLDHITSLKTFYQ